MTVNNGLQSLKWRTVVSFPSIGYKEVLLEIHNGISNQKHYLWMDLSLLLVTLMTQIDCFASSQTC